MNYSEIIEACQTYSDNISAEVVSSYDKFILITEAKINRILKTRKATFRYYIPCVTDQEYYCLPSDYSGMVDLQVNKGAPGTESSPMRYITPDKFNIIRNGVFEGHYYYGLIANQIQVFPLLEEGRTIEMVYYKKVPNLNATTVYNWLSNDAPDVYIAGIMAEVELTLKNYEVADVWSKRMEKALDEALSNDDFEMWSGPPIDVRVG